jgi:hypothetical protein
MQIITTETVNSDDLTDRGRNKTLLLRLDRCGPTYPCSFIPPMVGSWKYTVMLLLSLEGSNDGTLQLQVIWKQQDGW